MKKSVEIIGGGTVSDVRCHLALAAMAYGGTARRLEKLCKDHSDKLDVRCHLTRMALGNKPSKLFTHPIRDAGCLTDRCSIVTNEDVAKLIDLWKKDVNVKIIFFNAALVDYSGSVLEKKDTALMRTPSGKLEPRLDSRGDEPVMQLSPMPKLVGTIREGRKDIFLVAFKTTCGATQDEQYQAGLRLLKTSSCNLVLANDVKTRLNMVITPEEARYHVTTDRSEALKGLVEMAYLRSHLTFTHSTVVAGDSIPWDSILVPSALRTVVNYCIESDAYKPFLGATVGHFACKVDDKTFLTSKRKTNFNDLSKNGLVKVVTDGPDSVIAYGAKPSVGGQSQRIVFSEHADCDCIVHFHCPIKPDSEVPTVSQRAYECGSHECGQNTSRGLKKFGNLYAVYLDNHGPNIVFNRDVDAEEVINFVRDNFDLKGKTGGPV